jgi:2-amino-4-hydroxy-6-hydroxymethyldihydropteridine diphosphokinase
MAFTYVGLGSNLADPRVQIERALGALGDLPKSQMLSHSRLYRTSPWGYVEQPEFINAAAKLETQLTPREMMQALLSIEQAFGRERSKVWGPRVLDLDLLMHDRQIINEPGLHLPHPRLHERAFVLLPLADIAPDLDIPDHGLVAELLRRIDISGCNRLETP